MLNEIVFLHRPTSTLLVADAYYSGHCCYNVDKVKVSPPNPFTRIWFKMTKKHWASSQLPSYRTSRLEEEMFCFINTHTTFLSFLRVMSSGEPEVLVSCIRDLVQAWSPVRMISAHGDTVTESRPGQELLRAWTQGLL